jgi:hypothetical protein
MTLMDAPKFDTAGSQRRTRMYISFCAGVILCLVACWFFAGRPIDLPWTWWTYWAGGRTTDQFLSTVESNDLPRAYGIWVHDPDWQQHQDKYKTYPFDRFKEDFGPNSMANDYGTISSHVIVAKKMTGGGLIVGAMINGRKSKPLFLEYFPKDHTLGFTPFELKLD